MKTAIFLGAGASASDGAPLQNNLFYEYFKTTPKGITLFNNDDIRELLADFFKKAFSIDVDVNPKELKKIEFPTFEEVIGILDLAQLKSESFIDYSNNTLNDQDIQISRIRFYLILLMAKAISVSLRNRNHAQLVFNLRKQRKLSKTFFISTNYDLLIDNALVNLFPKIKLDYSIDFINFTERNSTWKKISDKDRRIQLFKLHGSLNWLFCPSCNSMKITPKRKGVNKMLLAREFVKDEIKCNNCLTDYRPIIIPPTFYKNMSNVFLSNIWNKVEQELLSTKHIIFCGYSYPDADMHIKYLIKRAQINRTRKLKVSVINNHKGKKLQQKKDEEFRYKRFLGANVNYTDYSFQDFARDPKIVI